MRLELNPPPKKELFIVLAALCGACLISFLDAEISAALWGARLHDTAFRRSLSILGRADIALFFAVFICWITGNRRFLWRFLCSGVFAGIIVLATKLLIARERPRGGDFHSFPSGHTQVAFVWATLIAVEFPKFALPAYAAACGVGLSRITSGAHFPSDVVAGGAIGFFAAGMVVANTRTVPRWLYRLTKRTSTGLAGVAAFVFYIIIAGERILWAAAVIAPVAAIAAIYADRKSLMRYLRGRTSGNGRRN